MSQLPKIAEKIVVDSLLSRKHRGVVKAVLASPSARRVAVSTHLHGDPVSRIATGQRLLQCQRHKLTGFISVKHTARVLCVTWCVCFTGCVQILTIFGSCFVCLGTDSTSRWYDFAAHMVRFRSGQQPALSLNNFCEMTQSCSHLKRNELVALEISKERIIARN